MNKKINSSYYGFIITYTIFAIYFFLCFFQIGNYDDNHENNSYKAIFIVFVTFGLVFRFFKVSFPATVMIILFDIIATYFFFSSIESYKNSIFLLGMMPFVIDWRNRLLISNAKDISSNPAADENSWMPLEQEKTGEENVRRTAKINRSANSFMLSIFTVYLFFAIYLLLTMFQRGWNPDYANNIYQVIFVLFVVIGIVLRCLDITLAASFAIVAIDIIASLFFILGMNFDQMGFVLFAIIPFIPDWVNTFLLAEEKKKE